MDFGKTALTLNGGGGLGRAISKALTAEGVNDRPDQDVSAESTSSIPLGRYGKPEEMRVVTFLASERAAYINSSAIRVDGGLIASILKYV